MSIHFYGSSSNGDLHQYKAIILITSSRSGTSSERFVYMMHNHLKIALFLSLSKSECAFIQGVFASQCTLGRASIGYNHFGKGNK